MATLQKTTNVVVAGVDMEVEFDYSAARAGKYSGPWEHCYPDEDEEIDVIALYFGKDEDGNKVDILSILNEVTLDDICQQISEQACCDIDY